MIVRACKIEAKDPIRVDVKIEKEKSYSDSRVVYFWVRASGIICGV